MQMDLQLFGGRGAGSGGKGGGAMDVPYDEWGEEMRIKDLGNGSWMEDRTRFIEEERMEKATKKMVLEFIDSWRDDDGYWTDDDMAGYIAYANGNFIDVKDLNGKNYPKSGIIGAYYGDASQSAAWGDEWAGSGQSRRRTPMTISVGEDNTEYSNTHQYWEATGAYRERVKTTYYRDEQGHGRVKHEVVRRSTVKPLGDKK